MMQSLLGASRVIHMNTDMTITKQLTQLNITTCESLIWHHAQYSIHVHHHAWKLAHHTVLATCKWPLTSIDELESSCRVVFALYFLNLLLEGKNLNTDQKHMITLCSHVHACTHTGRAVIRLVILIRAHQHVFYSNKGFHTVAKLLNVCSRSVLHHKTSSNA